MLLVDNDFLNVISWVSSPSKVPWRFHFCFNEILSLFVLMEVSFKHLGHSANGFADALAKQRVEKFSDLMAITISLFFCFSFCCWLWV